mgnify:CR=1 FL=1
MKTYTYTLSINNQPLNPKLDHSDDAVAMAITIAQYAAMPVAIDKTEQEDGKTNYCLPYAMISDQGTLTWRAMEHTK